MKRQNISDTITWNGKRVTFTWIPTTDIENYYPITQACGVCLNNNKEVLICHEPGRKGWGLPGGTTEKNETPIETLKRELIEEVDAEVEKIQPIGVQKVEESGKTYYQSRFYCQVKKLLPQTLDPDTGLLYERKFVPLSKLNNYLKWGDIGEAIVKSVGKKVD